MKNKLALALCLLPFLAWGADCGSQGDAQKTKEQQLNLLKNRTSIPAAYTPYPLANLVSNGKTICDNTKSISTVGYLISLHKSNPESANCHNPSKVDYHVYVGETPDAPKDKQIVVELTPQFGTVSEVKRLKALVGKQVQFQGWMFYDTEHLDVPWRANACEVHPVIDFKEVK